MSTAEALNPYQAPETLDQASFSDETCEVGMWKMAGRIGRLRYLAYTTSLMFIVYGLAGIIAAITIPIAGEEAGYIVLGILAVVFVIPMIVLMVSYGRRRLNDMNMSGWLYLILLIPFIGSIFALMLMFMPGTDGDNQYGTRPPSNGKGVVFGALLLPLIAVIGILAAIALPAYQDYQIRADAASNSATFETIDLD